MLKTRLISALILLPLVLAAFLYGPSWFVVIFLLISLTLAVSEMSMMIIPAFERRLAGVDTPVDIVVSDGEERMIPHRAFVFPAITVALGWAVLLFTVSGKAEVAVGGVALAALAALLIGSFSAKTIDLAVARAFGILISLCYGAFPWLVVWQLYKMGPNARYILLTMAVTWLGDTGGYFGGRFYGGKIFGDRKLAPVISPKKTWEGALAGLGMSIVGAWFVNLIFLGALGSFALMTKVGLFGGLFAQLGDLVESTFKRFSGVKDSGVLIPGHGGFLDRVDGILFCAPIIWAILYYFG